VPGAKEEAEAKARSSILGVRRSEASLKGDPGWHGSQMHATPSDSKAGEGPCEGPPTRQIGKQAAGPANGPAHGPANGPAAASLPVAALAAEVLARAEAVAEAVAEAAKRCRESTSTFAAASWSAGSRRAR